MTENQATCEVQLIPNIPFSQRKTFTEYLAESKNIVSKIVLREEEHRKMLKQRDTLQSLNYLLNNWIRNLEGVERLSQGNPALRSLKAFCEKVKADMPEVNTVLEDSLTQEISGFDAIKDVFERLDALAEEQPSIPQVEEIRACLGEGCGTMETILGLLYE